ncbi:MAG TPA: hypothetical protein VGG39_22990 [Polyangiaceae bacterium]|jgi:hypothetical protein
MRAPTTMAPTIASPRTVPPTTPFQSEEEARPRGGSSTVERGVMTVATTGGTDG